ncbi:hypothetical protein BDK89_2362 [Ilumatobacter fluminis]|uniref:DUF6285 domain-containing protein n=1 Tax=Ilumatobacter fluminis TaxID=467091 RepID=A0A4R7I049_9ACTN|nr:DUF6285 domain-containing protein [Ilumatobacter fluminis]TDT16765.1 hypothetical protein BDK89_2362 [Ilumatobacter fluminis]
MAAPHDNPTAAELTEAVRDWLADDVGAADESPNRFHLRVATNVLDIVAREIELGPGQAEAHAARLEHLGVSDDRELSDALRSGAIDYRDESVRSLIWDSVVDKLTVANPRYLERNPR